MKKVAVISVLVIALALLLSMLSSNTEQKDTNIIPKEPETYSLRFGHNTPENSALHQASLLFAKKIREKTDGQVIVDVYPAQQLGNDHQMVEMARNGELDILLTPTAKMSVPVPSMQYADLPFYFPTRNDVYEMLDGEPGQMLFRDLKNIGLVGMAFWENGFKHFTANTPLLSPSSFIDKKIRVMKSRIIMEQFNSFGAEPVAIDFHSTRQALADRVVDGQENPLIAIYSMGFHEVQDDLTLSEHAYLGYVLSVSEQTMKRLPFNIQTLLFETAHEVTPWEREETQRREQELVNKIRQSGVTVHQLEAEQRLKFAQKTKHIASQFENVIGPALISKTEELMFKKYGSPSGEDYLLLGLNADFTNTPGAGLAIKRGIQLALDEINSKGGVLGKQLHLMARDHQIISGQGLENLKYFMEQPNLIAVVGGKHSAVITSELDLINDSKIPYLIPWAAAEKITEQKNDTSSIFRISANDQLASEFIAQYTLNSHSQPAIVAENTIWGRGNVESIQSFLSSKGLHPATEFIYNRGQKSYKSELESIVNSGSDSIILIANSNEGDVIFSELASLKSKLPIISHWGILGGDLFEDHKQILQNLDLRFFQTFLFDRNQTPQAIQLLQKYKDKYGVDDITDIRAQHAVAQSYDLVQILALAIENAGSTDREKISRSLENIFDYNGVVKHYDRVFSESNHDALNTDDFFMAKFNKDGRIIPSM